MRVLVAGGAGFLGSHVVDRLLGRGNEVVVIDNFSTSSPRNLDHLRGHVRLRIIRRDIANAPFGRYDRVYHLASPASPEDYGRYPIETLMTNASGTHRLLELARKSNARFLLASTSETYGDPLEHPQRETYFGNVNPVGPRSAYDEGKRFAEALTTAYLRVHGVNARIVRIFNAYGPRMRPGDGRMPSAFITSALRGEPILVHGTGRQTRSLCYVEDVARGLLAAMQRGHPGGVYNIGRPDEQSVIEFARAVHATVGGPSPIHRVRGREGDVQRRRPDIRKARAELGWRPTISMRDGLRRTVAWYRTEIGSER